MGLLVTELERSYHEGYDAIMGLLQTDVEEFIDNNSELKWLGIRKGANARSCSSALSKLRLACAQRVTPMTPSWALC